jgi:hypothetical protein
MSLSKAEIIKKYGMVKIRKYRCILGENAFRAKRGYYFGGLGAYEYDPVRTAGCVFDWCGNAKLCRRDMKKKQPVNPQLRRRGR